jgi:Glycosyltransferase 61
MSLAKSLSWAGKIGMQRLIVGAERRLGRSRDLFDVAKTVMIMAPATCNKGGEPCVMLPGQLDRVKSAAFNTQLQLEIEQLHGAERSHQPMRRFEIRDAIIHGSSIFAREGRRYYNYGLADPAFDEPIEELDCAALRSSFIGTFFFGHWLRDDCASHLMAETEAPVVSLQHPDWPDTGFYQRIFGQDYRTLRKARVKRLILYDDITQSAHKAERFLKLRDKLEAQVAAQETGHIVYLKRGDAGASRRLLNENEITGALEKRGVKIVQAEGQSAEQLVQTLRGSKLVISIEGSQISHALYTLRQGGGVLAIQPPRRLFNSHMDWTRVLDMRYGIVVGIDQGNQDFTLPVDDLLRTIDLMEQKIG